MTVLTDTQTDRIDSITLAGDRGGNNILLSQFNFEFSSRKELAYATSAKIMLGCEREYYYLYN